MRALTVRQPWASLILRGGKDIENRDWHTTYSGIVAIHSSARMLRSDMEDACELMRRFVPRFSAYRFQQDEFPLGVILGTVEMTGCVRHSYSPWFTGRFGFELGSPICFAEPIACRGALGLWRVADDTVALAREQYRLAGDAERRKAGAA